MGYTTTFEGRFDLDKKLAPEHAAYLREFSAVRHMRRSLDAANYPDPIRQRAGLPLGLEAGYFVGQHNYSDKTVLDGNRPPTDQPGLWCKWTVTDDDSGIEWNGIEKFYDFTRWLEYIIAHFLAPWGYGVSGGVAYQGEDENDKGIITVIGNQVFVNITDLEVLARAHKPVGVK